MRLLELEFAAGLRFLRPRSGAELGRFNWVVRFRVLAVWWIIYLRTVGVGGVAT